MISVFYQISFFGQDDRPQSIISLSYDSSLLTSFFNKATCRIQTNNTAIIIIKVCAVPAPSFHEKKSCV